MASSSTPTSEAAARFVAPGGWTTIDFISDLHLTKDTPRTFEAWASFVRETPADAICILGDLFEAWIGDDSRHEGFEAEVTEVLVAATARRPVYFMAGNRDFLLGDGMLHASGMQALSDPTAFTAFGRTALLTHGDALCLGDTGYQQYRRVVRSEAWQHEVLSRPLAVRRIAAREMRSESERQQASGETRFFHDVDAAAALQAMRLVDATMLIHGHTHRPGDDTLAPGLTRHVMTDWDLDQAVPPRAEVLRWRPEGLSRLLPGEALRPQH
jgi:UDP-2,3-diacylglucosamine hydrolase